MSRYRLTKNTIPDVKVGQPGYWLNKGEVEDSYGEWQWAIDTHTNLPVMVMVRTV